MITRNGTEIKKTDEYRRKYDSAIAEFVDECLMDGMATDLSSDDNGEYVALIGRRILTEDTQGFVDIKKYATKAEARKAYFGKLTLLACENCACPVANSSGHCDCDSRYADMAECALCGAICYGDMHLIG